MKLLCVRYVHLWCSDDERFRLLQGRHQYLPHLPPPVLSAAVVHETSVAPAVPIVIVVVVVP